MKEFKVERDVPQRLVIGPCLWTVMYSGLLKEELPDDVVIIAFVDDMIVVATAENCNFL